MEASLSPGPASDHKAAHVPSAPSRRWLCAVAALAALHWGLGIDCARIWSVTHDEYWHLPAGVAVWREARFDVDNLNPPLTRIWSALPAVVGGARLPRGLPADDAFALGDAFLSANPTDYHTWHLLARAFNLAFSTATGVLLAFWGRREFGPAAGIAAATLWLCCPTALANGVAATPDAGATLLFSATLCAAVAYSRTPIVSRALLLGALLGAAQLAKFTNVLLFPIVALTWGIVRWRSGRSALAVKSVLWQWLAASCVALAVWNAGYLFQGTLAPLDTYEFRSRQVQRLVAAIGPLARCPVPLPADYLRGFDRQRSIMEGSHPVYLDGVWSLQGFPDYYLRAWAYKTSHVAQAWLLCGVIAALLATGRRYWRVNLLLVCVAGLLVGVASSIGMQLGLRYILPAMPLLYLFSAQGAQALWNGRSVARRSLVVAGTIALCVGLREHPHHLAYFNEAAGGLRGGRNHLADSNLDWGQDLRELDAWLESHGVEQIGLAYFGMFPPSALGIDYQLPPSPAQVAALGRPAAGWYAVSVNFVLGRPHTIRRPDDSIARTGYQEYGYFRRYAPVTTIGGSIDVYHIEAGGRGR